MADLAQGWLEHKFRALSFAVRLNGSEDYEARDRRSGLGLDAYSFQRVGDKTCHSGLRVSASWSPKDPGLRSLRLLWTEAEK